MKNHDDSRDTTDLLRTTLSFMAVNLLWIFFAVWLLYGIVPVLLLAVVMNHMINRLEVRLLVAERHPRRDF
ncbi:hypothetical protein [Tritonibacter horizontis]|uniref:Histidinol phosphate aminotransferase n=1 Tax=Tritonibacter horizontis TaxID=1768241 RepID=A0A132C284_9RHOB|nr:hypothetical protein [Tritonibacter horizontis]KUP94708.1 hypothetical protein TRIHO_04020 [Tritonibacter horizontis]